MLFLSYYLLSKMFQRDIFSYSMLGFDQARRDSYLPKSAYVYRQMKRTNPYVIKTTKAERMAKIAANPKSLAYRQQRQIVLYRQPQVYPMKRQGELKGMDTSINVNPVLATTNTNGSSFVLNLINPGTGSFNRIGRKVVCSSLRLKGEILFNNNSAADPVISPSCRMVVVHDRQPNSGTVPTFDTIFGKTVQDGTESCIFTDSLRFDNTDRFSVILDRMVGEPNPGVFTTSAGFVSQKRFPFDIFKKINIITQYSGQSIPTTITDISGGAIYVFFRANIQSASNFCEIVNSQVRLRYKD